MAWEIRRFGRIDGHLLYERLSFFGLWVTVIVSGYYHPVIIHKVHFLSRIPMEAHWSLRAPVHPITQCFWFSLGSLEFVGGIEDWGDGIVDSTVATLCLFNIAMGNGPFIDGLPIKNGDFPWLC